MEIVPSKNPVEKKRRQKNSRLVAERRGTRGRAAHKKKARSTNKPYGGKMAR